MRISRAAGRIDYPGVVAPELSPSKRKVGASNTPRFTAASVGSRSESWCFSRSQRHGDLVSELQDYAPRVYGCTAKVGVDARGKHVQSRRDHNTANLFVADKDASR
jgi:hypothetical protein